MNVHTLSRPPTGLSIDEFFAWIETKDERYELVEGTPRLLPWVKRNHSRIASNFNFLLNSGMDRDRFEVHQGDFAIPTGPRSIRYADVLVETAGGSGQARTTERAILVVEVLSPSTTAEDFGRKQREYLGLPTLDTYLVASQDLPCLWQWTRDEAGNWPEEPLVITEGEVSIEKLAVSMPLAEIYRGVS